MQSTQKWYALEGFKTIIFWPITNHSSIRSFTVLWSNSAKFPWSSKLIPWFYNDFHLLEQNIFHPINVNILNILYPRNFIAQIYFLWDFICTWQSPGGFHVGLSNMIAIYTTSLCIVFTPCYNWFKVMVSVSGFLHRSLSLSPWAWHTHTHFIP